MASTIDADALPMMPTYLRPLALPYEVVQQVACMPKGKIRQATSEALMCLMAHDLFREIDTPNGRGYALAHTQEQLSARTGISVERLANGLRGLQSIGVLVKTAGRLLGSTEGSEQDMYWLTTLPDAYVPDPRLTRQKVFPQNTGTAPQERVVLSPQNTGTAPVLSPTASHPATGGGPAERGNVVVSSSSPRNPRNHTTTNTVPADPGPVDNATVTDLNTRRPVTCADGSPITDTALRDALDAAGFKGPLDADVQAAFDLVGPIAAEYVESTTAAGKGAGWIVRTLQAAGAPAIWAWIDRHPPAGTTTPAGGSTPAGWPEPCGACDANRQRHTADGLPYRCPDCHPLAATSTATAF